ncbi:hypothetical protein [Haloechinothrix halophila]|uniref:hypothetical protein n=1 Tax=Haloechinothrix halophila TaxID=1069073 RepID=UPI00054FC9DD|nr:hypothetical protein [Haloechinothrix halophila]
MPSQLHEALIELFHHRPALAAELLATSLGVAVPSYRHARLESCELTDLTPTEYRADTVVVLTDDTGPVFAIIVEIQLGHDGDKRWSWPVYLTTLRARLRCRTALLVLCPNDGLADWCATPISLGHPGMVMRPLTIGPDRVPVVTDPASASDSPELAVLSAMAHGSHPERDKILNALLAGLQAVDDDHADLYADVVLAALPTAARAHLEELMRTGTYEYQSDFARHYFSQGEASGEARGEAKGEMKALLAVLAARDIAVPTAARERIMSCTDAGQLEAWVRRAVTITTIDELFD